MRRAALLVSMVLAACKAEAPTTEPDPSLDESLPYEGETAGGVIPDLPPEPNTFDDAGEATEDRRCCNLPFRISDQEREDVDGLIVGSGAPFTEGVALTRGDGGWSAMACVPLNSSHAYQYRFIERYDAGTDDGGTDDAGSPPAAVFRASSFEPLESDGLGGSNNLIGPFADCESLDASYGMLP
jgi:hypothetical protein